MHLPCDADFCASFTQASSCNSSCVLQTVLYECVAWRPLRHPCGGEVVCQVGFSLGVAACDFSAATRSASVAGSTCHDLAGQHFEVDAPSW